MIYFYESSNDLANRGGGVNINWDGRDEELWGDVNPNNISNGDIADIIEMIGMPASDQVAQAEYDEYRDERDGSERLADRYGCWCKLTARDISCVHIYRATYILHTSQHAAYNLRGGVRFAVYIVHTRSAYAVYNKEKTTAPPLTKAQRIA